MKEKPVQTFFVIYYKKFALVFDLYKLDDFVQFTAKETSYPLRVVHFDGSKK